MFSLSFHNDFILSRSGAQLLQWVLTCPACLLILCWNNDCVARPYFPVINIENSVFPTYKIRVLSLGLSCPGGRGGGWGANGERSPSPLHLERATGMQPCRARAVSPALPAHCPFLRLIPTGSFNYLCGVLSRVKIKWPLWGQKGTVSSAWYNTVINFLHDNLSLQCCI